MAIADAKEEYKEDGNLKSQSFRILTEEEFNFADLKDIYKLTILFKMIFGQVGDGIKNLLIL